MSLVYLAATVYCLSSCLVKYYQCIHGCRCRQVVQLTPTNGQQAVTVVCLVHLAAVLLEEPQLNAPVTKATTALLMISPVHLVHVGIQMSYNDTV